jgi:hypothetical protein
VHTQRLCLGQATLLPDQIRGKKGASFSIGALRRA